jgi:CRP-like cAMP-binding protein
MPASTNKILSALPAAEYEQLAARLKPVTLKLGDILYNPEETIQHVYFVTEGVVALLATLEPGATVEAAVIGPA